MKPEAGGARHCQNCKKSVTDFTTMTDHQIVQHLQANPTACGRFAAHQIDRDLQPYYPETKPTQWRIAKWAMAASVLFAAAPAAWARPFAEMGYAAGDEKETGDSTKVTLRGRVCDGNGEAAVGASVSVIQGGVVKNHAVVQNEDGTFEIKNLSAGEYEVCATYIGHEQCVTTVLIDKELMLNFDFEFSLIKRYHGTRPLTTQRTDFVGYIIESELVNGVMSEKKRNWFRRLFHRK